MALVHRKRKAIVTSKALLRFSIGLALVGATVGCSSSSTAPAPPTPVTASISDPTGDTCGTGAGQNPSCSLGSATGATIYDITNVTTSRTGPSGGTYNLIAVTVTFAQPVVLPAAGASPDLAGTQLVTLLGFDTDGIFSDGSNFTFCGPLGTYDGVDYQVAAAARLADGNYPIQGPLPATTQTGEATVSVSGNSVTFGVPIAAIGNHPAGPFNLGVTVGNEPAASDCASNTGFTATSVTRQPLSITRHATGSPWWVI